MLKLIRVVTVLLDKQEIGPLIIDKISLDVFRTLHHMFQVLFGLFRSIIIHMYKNPEVLIVHQCDDKSNHFRMPLVHRGKS